MGSRIRPRSRGLYADRSTWVNKGRAWVNPATDYPQTWTVYIPRSRDDSNTFEVSSLTEATHVAVDHGVELTISDRAYPYLVQQGFVPPVRPDTVPLADASGADMWELDERMRLHQEAAGLLGLAVTVAANIAHERGFRVRPITTDTVLVDCAWDMRRLNLQLDANSTVIQVYPG